MSKDLALDKESSGNLPQLPKVVKNKDILTISKFNTDHYIKKGKGDKNSASRDSNKEMDFISTSSTTVRNIINENKSSKSIRGSVLTRDAAAPSTYVFALVQFHQERIKLKPSHLPTSPQMARMYMQFCGVMPSSEDAQNAANTHMLNMKIVHHDFEHQKLQWRPYVDFMSIPLQHSDHFVVYCRSAPVAVASYSPNVNLLELDFPEPCKPKAQVYTCALFKSMEKSDAFLSDDGNDLGLVKEMQSFVEIQSVYNSPVDCFRDAKTNIVEMIRQRSDSSSITACVFPLYHWLLLSDETYEKFDCTKFTEGGQREAARAATAAKTSIGDMYEFTGTNSHLVFSSKHRSSQFDQAATETFAKAGVNENAHKIGFKHDASDALITPTLTLRMLDEEVYRKELASEVLRKRQAAAAEFAPPPSSSNGGVGVNYSAPGTASSVRNRNSRGRMRTTSSGGSGNNSLSQSSVDTLGTGVDTEMDERRKVPTETVDQRLASLHNIIAARQRVIDQNDNLCVIEKFVKTRSKQLKEKEERKKKMGSSESAPNFLPSSPKRSTSPPQTEAGSVQQGDNNRYATEHDEKIDLGIEIPKSIVYAVQQSSHNKSDPYIMQRAMSMQQYDMNLSLQTIVADVKEAKKSYVKGMFQGQKGQKKKKNGGSMSSATTTSSNDGFSGFDFTARVSGSSGAKPSTVNGGRKINTIKKDAKVTLSTKLEVLEELLQNSVKGGGV